MPTAPNLPLRVAPEHSDRSKYHVLAGVTQKFKQKEQRTRCIFLRKNVNVIKHMKKMLNVTKYDENANQNPKITLYNL